MTELIERANSPIYCGAWLTDNSFVIGGGGGSSKSGISNFLNIYKVNKTTQTLDLVRELKLSSEEDCPMSCSFNKKESLLVCGINSSEKDITNNNNKSLKIFEFKNNELNFIDSSKILISDSKDEYQKATRFSKSGDLVFIGSAEGQVSILTTDNFKQKLNSKRCKNEVIDDGDFNEEETLFASSSDKVIHIWNLEDGEMLESLEPPIYKKTSKCQYRAIRFGRGGQSSNLFTFINSRKKDHSYIAKFKIDGFELLRTQSTGLKPITAVAMSNNGKLLAVALSDFSVKLIDTNTLKIYQTFKNLHNFPITTLQFNSKDNLLLSASTDSSFRVLLIPKEFPTGFQNLLLIVIAILILILSIIYQLWPIIQTKF